MDLVKISKVPFFQNFSTQQMEKIIPLIGQKNLQKGHYLIEQGELNLKLYFLIAGRVDIIVDEQRIVDISSFGEVFGEISIVSHQLSTAGVLAASDCIFAELDLNDINQLKDAPLQAMVYRSCAEILAIKLVKTNKIAKTYKNFIKDLD